MQRRHFTLASTSVFGSLILATYQQAWALSVSDLAGISNKDASTGLKTALEKGALAAVALLGRPDGFFGNEKVRIPLPGFLQDAAGILKTLGQGKRIDELMLSINRAAEAAVPMGRDLLVSSVRGMSVADAKNILTGGETSVTNFFAEKNSQATQRHFLAHRHPRH